MKNFLIKFFKVVTINIISIIVIFIVVDWFVFMNKNVSDYVPDYVRFESRNRTNNNLPYNENKKSIVTIGCSMTFGEHIDVPDTFAYKLQKYTNRKVYNRGASGEGVQHILWQLQYSDFFNKEKIVEPEYIIYTFIDDHLRRMYSDIMYYEYQKYLKYKKVGNELILCSTKRNIFDFFKAAYIYQKLYIEYTYRINIEDQFELFDLYLVKIKEEMEKKYPSAKFVVLVYPPNDIDQNTKEYTKVFNNTDEKWKLIEQQGIKVLRFDTNEYLFMLEDKYRAQADNFHPSGQAWDVIVPIVTEKLKLNN